MKQYLWAMVLTTVAVLGGVALGALLLRGGRVQFDAQSTQGTGHPTKPSANADKPCAAWPYFRRAANERSAASMLAETWEWADKWEAAAADAKVKAAWRAVKVAVDVCLSGGAATTVWTCEEHWLKVKNALDKADNGGTADDALDCLAELDHDDPVR